VNELDDPHDPRHELPLEDEVAHESALLALERVELSIDFIQKLIEAWRQTRPDDWSPHQRAQMIEAMRLIERARDLMTTDIEEDQ
jgi:hypothetical protein